MSGALRLKLQGYSMLPPPENDDLPIDSRDVFDVPPALNPLDTGIYAEMGIHLNRYRYGKLMMEAVGRRITIRDLVIELIDQHIEGDK